jgi:hypothetical protein
VAHHLDLGQDRQGDLRGEAAAQIQNDRCVDASDGCL